MTLLTLMTVVIITITNMYWPDWRCREDECHDLCWMR